MPVLLKGLAVSLALVAGLLAQGCREAASTYAHAEIEMLAVEPQLDGTTRVRYRPVLESLYYSPGAQLSVAGGRHKLAFVRCRIQQECAVSIEARPLANGLLEILVPAPAATLGLTFSDGVSSSQMHREGRPQ